MRRKASRPRESTSNGPGFYRPRTPGPGVTRTPDNDTAKYNSHFIHSSPEFSQLTDLVSLEINRSFGYPLEFKIKAFNNKNNIWQQSMKKLSPLCSVN